MPTSSDLSRGDNRPPVTGTFKKSSIKNDLFILDMTSGFRMMHIDKNNPQVVFLDKRSDEQLANTVYLYGKNKCKPYYHWNPTKKTVQCDFKKLPYLDKQFKLVIFDPPHRIEATSTSDLDHKFGTLCPETWQSELKQGFSEGWRVLDNYGTLVFKWAEHNKNITEILRLFPVKPVVIQKTGASKKKNGRLGSTFWAVFLKIPPPMEVLPC